MTRLERYEQLMRWINSYPHFASQEEGRVATQCERGANVFFIVARVGAYEIHRGYWQRDEFTSSNDFTILICDLNATRRAAAYEIGEELLNNQ